MFMPSEWKTRGLVLTAPLPEDVETVCRFIEQVLAGHVNKIVLQTRYRYAFEKHPECTGRFPLTRPMIKQLLAACRAGGIELIPKMNLLSHQSGIPNDPDDGILHGAPDDRETIPDGLLAAYPQFDETPNEKRLFYCRSLCPTHPDIKPILFDLMDELTDAFEAKAMHIGCDEAFSLGSCPRCRQKSNAALLADWVTALHDHLAEHGVSMMMWGDRFLNASETGYGSWEASDTHTEAALYHIPKDILLCDWHYEHYPDGYPSLDIFRKAGFHTVLSPWKNLQNARAFLQTAIDGGYENVDGVLMTTWCSSGELARCFLDGAQPVWKNTAAIVETLTDVLLA